MSVHPELAPSEPTTPGAVPWALAALPAERAAGTPRHLDAERARRRLEMWRELVVLRDAGDEFDDRIAPTGMDEATLHDLLGESQEALAARLAEAPEWFHRFTHAWQHHATPATDPAPLGTGSAALLEVARPLVESAAAHLMERIAPIVPDGAPLAGIAEVLRNTVPLPEISQHLSRTMVLELNVARLRGQLAGDTGEERFASYVELLRDPAVALTIWQEYPVLARLVDGALASWERSCVRLAERLSADLPELRETLWGGADPGRVVGVSFGEGDRHRDGQTVAIVRFEHRTVVYKPRDLAVDVAFQRYLDWFNGTNPRHELKIAATVRRDDYGWSEFVDADAECDSVAEVSAFYWRLGAELALLHSLRASDFHFENLIASGAHPVLIDLEALFDTSRAATETAPERMPDPATVAFQDSVMSVGLLPAGSVLRDRTDESAFRFDVSGIGGDDGQRSPAPMPTLDNQGTDEMRLVHKHVLMQARQNRPRLAGNAVTDLLSYQADVVAGFREAYERIAAAADTLLAPGGVVDGFADAPVRLIMRATYLYGRLLEDSTHPDFLRDALDRERCLAQLCAGWQEVPNRGLGIAAEIAALRRGDVPLFEFRPGGTAAHTDDGTVLPGMFDQAPLAAVRARIAAMGPADLSRQLFAIDAAFSAMAVGDGGQTGYVAPLAAEPVSAERLTAAAVDVGRQLAELAVVDGGRVGWFGLTLVDDEFWQFVPAASDLYSGISGIGLFLSTVAGHDPDGRLAELAETVLRESVLRGKGYLQGLAELEQLAVPGMGTESVGAFGVLGGLLYYWAHAARLHGATDHLDAAPDVLADLGRRLADDVHFDVVAGLPGAILALLALHEVAPGLGALDVARRAGDLLVERRVRIGDGCAWPSRLNAAQPLAGYSHGASGAASALARLHAVAGRPEYLDAITGALRYEAGLFDATARNWRDLREISSGNFMAAWCHGAPGIGLARHGLLRYDFLGEQRASLAVDLAAAVRTTHAEGLDTDPVTGTRNHSICHGDLGNLELLATVAGSDPAFPDATEVGRIAASLVDNGERDGWLCGVPNGTTTPGLMPGLAGIGYNLLRLADPGRVPSVLLVEPPSGTRR
jgi:type 2 lantibiotic biosynthesis protein LanM